MHRIGLIIDAAATNGVSIRLSDDGTGIVVTGPTKEVEKYRRKIAGDRDAVLAYLSGSPMDAPEKVAGDMFYELSEESGRTDISNAKRFIDAYEKQLLYVPPWRKWLSWDGSRWADDCGIGANQRATRYATKLWSYLPKISQTLDRNEFAKVVSFVRTTSQAAKISNFLSLASNDERVVCPVEELNSDPNLLNCVNGTVDLTTGEIASHNPSHRITQITSVPYDPDATCEKWIETLNIIFDGDADLIRFVQQLLGYSLSGETGEHILPIAYGDGFNGKSTVWNVTAELLGDYASLANDELLMGDSRNHPTEKAALYQKRFVAISEPEKGSKLKESRVKELTGDRLITARRMHEDFWSFKRTHTFWISSNHLPTIDGTDEGIWRRVKLIPFGVDLRTKLKPIPDFDQWLIRHEGAGILAWMVRGYLDYRQHGLIEPERVTAATKRYRDDSDELGDFIAEWCVTDDHGRVAGSDLYRVYIEKVGKKSMGKNAFGQAIAERFERVKIRGRNVYKGLRLREQDEESQNADDTAKHDGNEEGGIPGDTKNIGSEIANAKTKPTEKVSPGVTTPENGRVRGEPSQPIKTTVVHLSREPFDVRIDRKTKWGNPFVLGSDGNRAEVIAKYRQWIHTQPELMAALHELKGKRLGCWCSPESCHGDVLAELADTPTYQPPPTPTGRPCPRCGAKLVRLADTPIVGGWVNLDCPTPSCGHVKAVKAEAAEVTR